MPKDQSPPKHDPWDIDLEFAVVGSMLKDNAQIDIAAADLDASSFYDPMMGRIFDMVVILMGDGEAVTPVVVHSVMKTDPGLVQSGGLLFLESLVAAAPSTPNMRTWIKLLQDLALRRQLQGIAADLNAAALSPPAEISGRQACDMATEALLRAGRAGSKPIRSLRDIAMDAIREIEDVKAGKPIPIVPTGFHKLDKEIGGLRGSDLIIIPAKSGMGKTALKACMARNTARAGFPTLFFSKDMTSRQVAERITCDQDYGQYPKGIWYSRVRNHRLSDEEFDRYILAAQATDGWPIEICDDAGLTMQQISARARAFKAKHGGKLGIVFIDYLQKVAPTDPRENRERQVNSIASACKDLAKILDWPVVAGSQFNEDDKARSEKRPQPGDVRESKGIQHEADLMLSPWRPAYWVEIRKPMGTTPGDVAWNTWAAELREVKHRFDLLGLKNRHGRIFDTELFVDIASNAIRDESPYTHAEPEEQAARDLLTEVER